MKNSSPIINALKRQGQKAPSGAPPSTEPEKTPCYYQHPLPEERRGCGVCEAKAKERKNALPDSGKGRQHYHLKQIKEEEKNPGYEKIRPKKGIRWKGQSHLKAGERKPKKPPEETERFKYAS